MKLSLGRFKKIYDIAIVGGGVAGIAAGINGAARMKKVIIFEAAEPMGKIRRAREIRNYPGFPGATGEEISRAFLRHAREMGIEMRSEKVTGIVKEGDFIIYTEEDKVLARSVVLAVGLVSEKMLPGEEELLGRGVSYCIVCDGAAYSGGKVAVISEEEEGEEDAAALVRDYSCEVTYLPLYETLMGNKPFEILKLRPRALNLQERKVEVSFEDRSLLFDGVFLIKKMTSPARLIRGLKMVDKYVQVNRNMETSIPGVFAAGDCTGAPFKIAKAIGEGQVAALNAVKYISNLDSQRVEAEL
jgi:thioredoxin reductase (NADPH)